jgi:hypothetical protein
LLTRRLKYITDEQVDGPLDAAAKIGRILHGLARSLRPNF